MLEGVLFDLDGTLLDVAVDEFLGRYFHAVRAFAGPRFPSIDLLPAILAGTDAMQRPHEGRTNRDVFADEFRVRTGLEFERAWPVFEEFYDEVFPGIGADYRGTPGARDSIEAARALGLKVAVATQPIFPLSAIRHRLEWAGLGDVEFDAITTYEDMRACKPLAAYFRQTAEMIGCEPSRCLMVGDDRAMDLPAAAVGMRTFYVGDDRQVPRDERGELRELPALLERLARGEGGPAPSPAAD